MNKRKAEGRKAALRDPAGAGSRKEHFAAMQLARRCAQYIRNRNHFMVGQVLCNIENPAKFLRLVAKALDGKLPKRYDAEIETAYEKACRRALRARPAMLSRFVPTFAQFRKEFPRHAITERSLRRSLKLRGLVTRPDKRGRPKK
jgi:hypothetical protein